jgi:hypothetical protein
MARKRRIGTFNHSPGPTFEMGPDGSLRHTRVRKRFPHLGMVPLIYAIAGTLACAGVSWALKAVGLGRLLPQRISDAALPPSPTMDNILFGAGLPETALAWGLAGYWLWTGVWRTRVPQETQNRGFGAIYGSLLGNSLGYGILLGFFTMFIGACGVYVRTAPAAQPWGVRPFFAVLAAPVLFVRALVTGTIPLVVIILSLAMGVVTAAAAAALWREYPEQPIDN